jgi:tRNA(Ile)-lysidine synthase
MLLEKVKATLAQYRMLEGVQTVLVAVSGGVDSVVLLTVLQRLAPDLSAELIIAHLNHGLRGRAAEEDARFVQRLGESLGLRIIQERADVGVLTEKSGMNLEAAARHVRRDFLRRTAQTLGADRIALGHTRNDRAETLLFHLVRGAGPTGIIGIRPINPPYIRPLIDVSRDEVLAFAREEGLSWREDLTNRDLSFSRNRLRHQIVPLLQEMNPHLLEALSRTADLLLDEQNALDELLDAPWKRILIRNGIGCVVLDREQLSTFAREIQHLLLRRAAARARGHLQGIEKKHIEALAELTNSARRHAEIHLPALLARAEGKEVYLTTQREGTASSYSYSVDLGRNEFSQLDAVLELMIKEKDASVTFTLKEDCEMADADRVHFPLYVRSRMAGDRFQPLGMNHDKKLKSFLIDEHVPVYERDRLPLLCDQERIIWVVGRRLSEAVRVTPVTKRLLIMRREALS